MLLFVIINMFIIISNSFILVIVFVILMMVMIIVKRFRDILNLVRVFIRLFILKDLMEMFFSNGIYCVVYVFFFLFIIVLLISNEMLVIYKLIKIILEILNIIMKMEFNKKNVLCIK